MELTCPHCSTRGISAIKKWFAGKAFPLSCSNCGKLSSVSGVLLSAVTGIFYFVFLAAAWFSLSFQSWLPIVLSITLYIVTKFILVWYAPLIPTSETEVRKIWFGTIVFIILILLIGYYFDKH